MLNYDTAFSTLNALAKNPTHPYAYTPVRPSDEQLRDAVSGLQYLQKMNLPAPCVGLLEDGGFFAYWSKSCGYASVDFDADGMLIWAVSRKGRMLSGIFREGEAIPNDMIKIALSLKD